MNGNNQGFNDENRYEMRKRKRMNRILNASILAVGALIVFFAVQLFLPGSEEASEEEMQDNIENEESTEEETAPEDSPQTDNQQETPEQEESPDTNSENNTNEQNQNNESNESDNTVSPPDPETGEGDWEPIGTEQSGSFTHDFNEDSQNWVEMEAALRYATGLSEEEMETWQIENGGGPNKVIGTVSTSENADTPYQVTMEFIENEGWKPLEIERLNSNPYH